MLNRTPLYEWHLANGARMVDFAGWEMPVQYSSIVDEHQAVRTAAGIFDISHMGRLVFEGPDALDLVQQVYTNDASSMRLGQIRYGLICNDQGGILDDVLVYRFGRFWLMVVNASNRVKILDWIKNHRGSRQASVTDQTISWPMIAVQGPRAAEIVTSALAATADKPVDRLNYYYGCVLPADSASAGVRTVVSRMGYTGEDGFEIITTRNLLNAVMESLVGTARRLSVDLKPCGLGARDTLRLEAGMPLYGHELSETIDPLQAGLGWAVKMDKGGFVGREALARRQQEPGRPARVGLALEGKRIAREGCSVSRDGRTIGQVTSGTFSPTLQKAIAMAYVAPACTVPQTPCEVDIRGKSAPARVVPLPFYSRTRTP
jgi:aminomethyltransferase